MKKILGLDLGTTSIGWALVNESENENEKSSIIKLGVRVNPLTVDEQQNFERGKSITTNADRTLKRSMRHNLQRYKLRRENLIEILKENGFIFNETVLSENGNRTTFETYRLRAKAATAEISLEEFARVLLMINKKRGYKSSRKAKGQDEGQLIDGMEVAKRLYNENLTPGQLCLQLLKTGKKYFPDFYRSDLQTEFDRIWEKQQEFYPEILNNELKEELRGKKREAVWVICAKHFVWKETIKEWSNEEAQNIEITKEYKLEGIYGKRKRDEAKIENLTWRSQGLYKKLSLEQFVIILQEINIQINGSSGYLGAISDRSKELYFNKQTVGQYQMAILTENPNASLRNMVFYRQDYLDEFNMIWDKQAEYHKELSEELKNIIRDVIIFYQRKLKSQKGLISFCEFESRKIEVEIDGKKKTKTVGNRVIPRSSPLFQEFKIWQVLNNLEVSVKGRKAKKQKEVSLFAEQEDPLEVYGKRELYQEEKELLAIELSVKDKLTKSEILKLLLKNSQELDLNFREIQGNLTQSNLFDAYIKIIEHSTGEIIDKKKSAAEVIKNIEDTFKILKYNTDILHFNSDKTLDEQPMYKLWHLLYSFEGDNSVTGNEKLINQLSELYGFEKEYVSILANITFQNDYGSLSAKAIRKILPYLKEGNKYDVACEYAGYRHSKSSSNKDEIENKILKDKLDVLPKNSLRNPVVEKILNQMINVINTIIDTYGKPDEIRIELARELKKNSKERDELTKSIAATTRLHDEYKKILSQPPFKLNYISRNDIIRYKLYEELKDNGYHTLYSNTYISPGAVFSGDFDVEHIIPQSRLFDDSFSNKTLELRSINLEKGNKTAYDFINEKYGGNGLEEYLNRIEMLFKQGVISRGKYNKLKMQEKDIPENFINRDLGNTQYITKYAKTMLGDLVKRVVSTTGSITDALREDWQLIDVMKELNWDKYNALGLTYYEENRDGRQLKRIKDWTKRNDHRHHAMDALTVAFTKDAFIQLFNNMNASLTPNSNEFALKNLYVENGKVKPPMPLNEFRIEAKKHLENTLISIKAKNKVVTTNINKTKKKGGTSKKSQETPRGQLHNETIYGSQKKYVIKEEKIGTTFDEVKIMTVSKPTYREVLLKRLQENGNDPKKAFGGKNAPAKNPILINETEQIPEKVKTVIFETVYTIRKEISPDLKLDKIIDVGVRRILENRLNDFNNDPKKAFSNLDENPILNKNGKSIKRVTISGISNAEALHDKCDKDGKLILDGNDKTQAVDFVSTSNNHHVAVYRDADGNLQENVVSFFEAVTRKNLGQPIIDKEYKVSEGWEFLFSMKQNEYFVFPNEKTGFNPKEIDLLNPNNYAMISPNLFRVQKFSKVVYGNSAVRDYVFRLHLETAINDNKELKDITYKSIKSLPVFNDIVKVRVNHIGKIVSVGEY
jgi:CRISPR-associated protein Cas9/Csn1, subtype II/NMEMI